MSRRPLVTRAMCGRGRSLTEVRVAPQGGRVAFVARGPGGTELLEVPVAGGPETVVTTSPAPLVRGGVFDWSPDGSFLVFAGAEGTLCRVPAGGGPCDVLAEPGPVSGVAVAPTGDRVVYVVDTRRLEVAAFAGDRPVVLADEADFVLDPAWSPDGASVAWHEWDVPDMPWDGGRIVVGPADGTASPAVVAGGAGVAVQQPRFSPDGRALAWLSDAGGRLQVWVGDAGGERARPLVADTAEHAGPAWGSGQGSFAWSPDGRRMAFTRNEGGFGSLHVAALAGGPPHELGLGVHSSLSWRAGVLAALRSGARTPTGVTLYCDGSRTVAARGPVGGFERAGSPEPEAVSWRADDGAEVHGRLYAGNPGSPLLVWIHGGPTGQREVSFDARAAYFLDRGWAILVPDPRGSTGWGRAYAQALRGRWGELDVDDVAAGMVAAGREGWGDGRRMVPMGASAGGMAVLLLLARHPGLAAAGVDLYGPTDLLDLARTTHRFEAHYTATLVAPLPGGEDLHVARSPLTWAERIRAPLLVLHGSDDEVVRPAQSHALVERVRAAGGVVEHHVYEGEGHGWRRPGTVEDELARIDSFLDRHVLAWSP